MATSPAPYGVGILPERWWRMTPREYDAIRHRWAEHQALTHSAHFDSKGLPFQPEDFLSAGRRRRRIRQAQADRLDVLREERTAATEQNLPEWAQWYKDRQAN